MDDQEMNEQSPPTKEDWLVFKMMFSWSRVLVNPE